MNFSPDMINRFHQLREQVFGYELKRARSLLQVEVDESRFTLEGKKEEFPTIAHYLYREERFIHAGIESDSRSRYLHFLVGAVALSAFSTFLSKSLFFLPIPFILYFLQIKTLESRSQKRQTDFDRDYAALLLSLSSGLKTGLDPLVALCRSAALFQPESVIRKELEGFELSLTHGKTEDEAIDGFARSVAHPDIKLFRMAFKLARKEGASLSLCLQRLARVTRQRQSFRRKTRGAVAMQKLSAFGIGGCTLMIGAIQGFSNTEMFLATFSHPGGRIVISVGMALVVIGIVWMLNIAKLRV